ncbi:MAG: hypothetical protein KDJ29_14070 [Hyphomicrobiales bacterium]|nr:hypothetical protein [Hyphomicrobiales bacterium]
MNPFESTLISSIVRKSGYRFFAHNDALLSGIDQLWCLQMNPFESTLISSIVRKSGYRFFAHNDAHLFGTDQQAKDHVRLSHEVSIAIAPEFGTISGPTQQRKPH